MELLAPAGSLRKLRYAFRYGADAAYMGLPGFSLRANAENINDELAESPKQVQALKGDRKLYCALNIYFHKADLGALERSLERIAEYPFDAFIVSDIGIVPLLQRRFPDLPLHLSTQANCTNPEAARMYYRMGFSRIVPGRELSLSEIAAIKDHVPELELEVFVHGAVCIAYSGRCFISKWAADRSANQGDCAHSCRWSYRLALEEEQRPGEYLPVEIGETADGGFTTLMSSKDICMIDYLADLRSAGVDSLKIEGRIKSLYYVAVVTRAYRYALDHPQEENPYRSDLFAVSHREYSTGFYFGRDAFEQPTLGSYRQTHLFLGSIEDPAQPEYQTEQRETRRRSLHPAPEADQEVRPGARGSERARWGSPLYLNVKNTIRSDRGFEFIGPRTIAAAVQPGEFRLLTREGTPVEKLVNQSAGYIQIDRLRRPQLQPVPGWLLRAAQPQ